MKALGLTPWPIYPAHSGGQERCFNLLSQVPHATVFALDWQGNSHQSYLGDMAYQVIPADPHAIDRANKLMAAGIKTYDPIPMLTKDSLVTFRNAIDAADPDLVILEHPWLLDLIGDRPYLYDSHNCESYNTEQQLGRTGFDFELVTDLERRAVQGAEHMTYTSDRDLAHMAQYFTHTTPATLIPNGTHQPTVITSGNSRNLVFIGSNYGPNIEAAQNLANMATQLPGYTIQILGHCATQVHSTAPNVQLLGPVTDRQLDFYLTNAHQFINLMSKGSGTHLKLARAMAYGIPVVTTPIGGRGYTSPTLVTTNLQTVDAILEVTNSWQKHHNTALAEAQTLTWDTIGNTFNEVLRGLQ